MIIIDGVEGIDKFGLFAGLDSEQVDMAFFLRTEAETNILPIAVTNLLGCAACLLDVLLNTRVQVPLDIRVLVVVLLNSKEI